MKLQVTLSGTTSLLMHADTLTDPLHPLSKEMKRISGKRTKTDDDHLEMSRLEFASSLYRDASGVIVMPGTNLTKNLIEGARNSKRGPKIERGVTLLGTDFPLTYAGPADAEALFADPNFVDRRSVKVGTARVMRTRPIFREWGVTYEVYLDSSVCSLDDFNEIAADAGNLIGLGDHRKIGGHGRYTANIVRI